MGWSAFIEGCLSLHFAATQEQWFCYLKKQYSGRRWVTQLIQKLVGLAWDQWEHWNGVAHRELDCARHQRSSCLVCEALAMGPRILTGSSLQSFNEGYKILCKPVVLQEAWLASIEAALNQKQVKLEKLRKSSTCQQRCMSAWLCS